MNNAKTPSYLLNLMSNNINYGYKVKTIYEMVKLDYDNIYPTHSCLVCEDNDCWFWFENADFNNRGIHRFNS